MKPISRGLIMTALAALMLSGCKSYGDVTNADQQSQDSQVRTSTHYADPNSDRLRRTVYAAIGLGASHLEPDTSEVDGSDVNDRVNAGSQITLGVDMTKHLSLEVHSADLGSAGISPAGRISYNLLGGSALIYAGKNRHRYRRNGFTGYGRIGYGRLENSSIGDVNFVKDNASHILFGAGLEYMTRIGLGVRGEVISYEEDVLYGQLGLIYRLGKRQERRPVQIVKTPESVPVVTPVVAIKIPEPIAVLPDLCDQFNGVLDGVNFHSDSADLTDSAVQVLNGAADTLGQCDRPVHITAHTDGQGSAEYNQTLSAKRAITVARFLLKSGIDKSRLSARAFGESRPIDTNETKEGRLRNRRVELIAQ